jgi:hypothetical protein
MGRCFRQDLEVARYLRANPRHSTDDVLEAMSVCTEASLPEQDGIVSFVRMYRMVTERVHEDLLHGDWRDAAWMASLVIEFADLFFEAYVRWVCGDGPVPEAWRVLFQRRYDREVSPLAAGFLGLNAHINRDLPVALFRTCRRMGVVVRDGTPHAADFFRINTVLDEVEVEAMNKLADADTQRRSRWIGGSDQRVAMRLIHLARTRAWRNAQWLDRFGPFEALGNSFLRAIDRATAVTGRLLLLPGAF